MKFHLVGGFLGSGKTTAIINASHVLLEKGMKVGIITNDQGKYLVDTAFFRLEDLPTVEVNGGCFCCNFDALDEQLEQLVRSVKPDVILAESVGSCADVIATVVKPLLALNQSGIHPDSFSVFCDSRMLLRRLSGQEMPFSDDVTYIFDKQIEEASLIVCNKIDLLNEARVETLKLITLNKFPRKKVLFQTSLSKAGVLPWLQLIQSQAPVEEWALLDIDYLRYGSGEAQLAWVDLDVMLAFPENKGRDYFIAALKHFLSDLALRKAVIGHLKFLVVEYFEGSKKGRGAKISIPTLEAPHWEEQIPNIAGTRAKLLVNARVEISANDLYDSFVRALDISGLQYDISHKQLFHPPQPKPTHRLG